MAAIPCREQVVAAALAVCEAVAGIAFERNRRTSIGDDDFADGDAVGILFEGDEEQNDIFAGEDAFDLPLLCQVATNKSGADGATFCNSVRANLQKALLADRTFGGLVRKLEITAPGEWIGVDVDTDDTEGFMLAFTVQYATVEGDPFTFS